MYKILIIIFLLSGISTTIKSQDVIFTKTNNKIISKIIEVSPKTIKYKKNENLDGPTYSILINEVTHIKFQNGIIEYFDKSIQSGLKGNYNLSNPSKDISTNFELKPKLEIANEALISVNPEQKRSVQSELKSFEKSENSNLKENTSTLKKLNEKSIIENDADYKISELVPPNSKFYYRKKKWLISTIVFSGLGIASIIQTNSLYNEYKSSTVNANSIRSSITIYQTVTPISISLASISAFGFISNLLKEKNENSLKISIENKISYNQIRLNYEF